MFAYCNNNPNNYSDPSGQFLVSPIINKLFGKIIRALTGSSHIRTHTTTPSIVLDGGPLVGEVGFSSTVTKTANEHGSIYAFTDVGNDEVQKGIGVNLGEWLGSEVGISSNNHVFSDIQITPHTHFRGTVGFDGVGITSGFINKDVSHDFTFRVGWGAIIGAFVAPKVLAFVLA